MGSQFLFLAVLMCLLGTSISQEGGATGPGNQMACGAVDLDTGASGSCNPCEQEKWFSLILNQRAETNNDTTCFNSFPLGQHSPFLCPHDLTNGQEYPELDLTKTPRGFIMYRSPFFRYNTKLSENVPIPANHVCHPEQKFKRCPEACNMPSINSTNYADNLDIGQVKHYYDADRVGPSGLPMSHDVDFQVLEWPGRNSEDQITFLQNKIESDCLEDYKSSKPALCSITKEKEERTFHMLKFQRHTSKLLHYPCNKESGTTIVALGLVAVYNEPEVEEDPHSKMFLSYSNLSIFNAPEHPLYVASVVLNQMARPKDASPRGICRIAEEEPKNCDFTRILADPLPQTAEDCDWRQKFFQDRGNLIIDQDKCASAEPPHVPECSNCKNVHKALSGDLRTVLDFTFVKGRLILGMRCGILIASDFLTKQLNVKAAHLISSEGRHQNTFKPVNKIASSVCCQESNCRRTIIAAYSKSENRGVYQPKELYISFDLGDTFQVKLMAEHISALNLMWGMYKVYSDWILYYQLLENPDPEDLKDDRGHELHPGFNDLRAVPDWDSLTTTIKERRFLYGDTSSASHRRDLEVRKRALRRYVRLRTAGTLGRFVRYRRQGKELELDLTPEWLKNEITHYRRNSKTPWQDQWTDANCDSIPQCRHNFINDPAVSYFLNLSNIIIKTPKNEIEEPFCDHIMSLTVLDEEDSLYVLCRVGFGDFSTPYGTNSNSISCSSRESKGEHEAQPDCTYPLHPSSNEKPKDYVYNECVNPIKYYAIYALSVKEKLPLVLIEERRSERLFTCKHLITSLDWYGCKSQHVEPELVRLPSSIMLLVKNCKNVLYYSPNGGRTMYNTQFYAHHSQFVDTDSGDQGKCSQTSHCKNYTNDERLLMYRLKALDIPPLISISESTNTVFMTMRNMFAYGIMGINKEFQMVVGEIFPNISESIISSIKSNDFIFPDFTASGLPFFGVALKLIYSHNELLACLTYRSRPGMRLVPVDFFFYKDMAYYYSENQDLHSEARFGNLGSSACHTYSFSANPKFLSLDVDEGGIVEVTSFDPQTNIHLALVSSEEKSLIVDVSIVERGRREKENLAHDWDINVKAIRNYKPRITVLVDSFFGVENNNMLGFNTHVSLANTVELRCHVQPITTVSVHIECRDKKMVVHEDEHRPQCIKGTFSKAAFEYRLKKGDFDPNLAGYWMSLNEKDGKELIKLDRATGDLVIVYDYIRFGCPLEPYKDDFFVPDLRFMIYNA